MVPEPTLVGPKSMASASANKVFPLKYSCEEVYERMEKGLCIFCDELDIPGHHQLKHKGIQIQLTECYDDQEEVHQETVTNPNQCVEAVTNLELFKETVKNSEPLERESVLQVPGSVSDVFLVHRVVSHVKEVEELPQGSTNSNEKNVAHQVFDKMPLAVTSKEKQRKSLKAWKFKFKISFKRSKLMDDMFSFVEETAWLNRDHKETIWDCVKKEFKETMAACGKKTIDRLKLVDETSNPAVYDGPIQIRVWESGGSALERVDEKSSGDVKFHLKHKWRSRVLQTISGWEFCLLPAKFDLRDWPKEESKPHQKKSHQIETFEVLSSLEPSRRSHNEQLGVSDDFPFAIVRTHISQSQSDLKCVTGNAHRMFDVMPLETKPLKNKRKEALQKTWWFKFKTSLERSRLMDYKLSFMEELGTQQGFNIEVWSGFDLEVCIDFITYGWECKKQINIGHVSLNGMCNELVYDEETKKLRNVKPAGCLCDLDQVNSIDEEEFVGFTEFSKLQLAMEFLLLNSGIFMNTRLLHDKINSVFVTLRVALALLVVSEHNKAIRTRYEKDHKLLFPKNQKLLNPEARFCTQYNDLEQLNTEHQRSPCLDYFTYLDFIWKQVLNCSCEAGYVSSRLFSVGGVHGFELQRKRLLVLNEIQLLENHNKVDLTIEENWFYNKPMIREVFHLQRPPELINIQGNPNFITMVLVQWKEHPPDQFFSGFYGQVLMLSSLRTRMFRRGKYCDRIISQFPVLINRSLNSLNLSFITGSIIVKPSRVMH